MYQFVDRPVNRLTLGSRLVLWAARGWAHARANGTCPPGAIAPALLHCGTGAALPHLHQLLSALAGDEPGATLRMPALDHPVVDDVEAILLQLWADALAAPIRARRTLELMLTGADERADQERATAAFEALTEAAARLVARGLPPTGFAVTSDARA